MVLFKVEKTVIVKMGTYISSVIRRCEYSNYIMRGFALNLIRDSFTQYSVVGLIKFYRILS